LQNANNLTIIFFIKKVHDFTKEAVSTYVN